MANELVYPISLCYLGDTDTKWGPWEIVRELAQNAIDSGSEWGIELHDETLVIWDKGNGMAGRHLLLGVSEKGPNAIGQFGEGLKLALLVLTRMGLRADILSSNLHLWNEPAEMMGETVFKICWEEIEPVVGTTITIKNWPYDDYQDLFILPGSNRILCEIGTTQQADPYRILGGEPGQLFVKGIYAGPLQLDKPSEFSYDLGSIVMNRDRKAVNVDTVMHVIGRLWNQVKSQVLWKRLLDGMVDRRAAEGSARFFAYEMAEEIKRVVRDVAQKKWGVNVAIYTRQTYASAAEWVGARVVQLDGVGWYFNAMMKDIVGTDLRYCQQISGKSVAPVPDDSLLPEQKETLQTLRQLATRSHSAIRVNAYVMDPNVRGRWDPVHFEVQINVNDLNSPTAALDTLIHELGHWCSGAGDLSIELLRGVSSVAAMLLGPYVWKDAA